MARVKHPSRYSAHSLWQAQCSRRIWLARPPFRLKPPEEPIQALGTLLHKIIFETLEANCEILLEDILAMLSCRLPTRELFALGEKCLSNFYLRYFANEEREETQEINVNLAVSVSKNIEPVLDLTSKEKPSYELFGVADEIRKEKRGIVIRDYKLSFQEDDDSMFRYCLQFGIYRACLKPKTEQEIFCEVFDLKTGIIHSVEPFSRGKIHGIVMETQKRILARSAGRNLKLCEFCPYQPVCANPHAAPREWKLKPVYEKQFVLIS